MEASIGITLRGPPFRGQDGMIFSRKVTSFNTMDIRPSHFPRVSIDSLLILAGTVKQLQIFSLQTPHLGESSFQS
jgi:hypothetical protein